MDWPTPRLPVTQGLSGAAVAAMESAERNAFTDAERQALERCAAALTGLVAESRP